MIVIRVVHEYLFWLSNPLRFLSADPSQCRPQHLHKILKCVVRQWLKQFN
jgi:hypothetical protein